MSLIADSFTVIVSLIGLFFFVAGTAGLLRFPDTHTRLHALTKADNVGLGFVVIALLPQAASGFDRLQLLIIWLLVLLASTVITYLVANHVVHNQPEHSSNPSRGDTQ